MKSLTLTIIANITSNYSESLGNIASVQKVYKNQHIYAIRSRESLKNAIMVQSGMYTDLQTSVHKATQKFVSPEVNAANCRALEGGYMNTKTVDKGKKNSKKEDSQEEGSEKENSVTYVRKSSFYLTDAIAVDTFINTARFHNNLYLATTEAKQKGLNVQMDAGSVGLMPYQYEYDKSYKVYSLTIDLEKVGKDENFNTEASAEEKIARVTAILDAVQHLDLVVKGNLDNAEPIFVVGGLSQRKTHCFENVVHMKEGALQITPDLKAKLESGFACGLLHGGAFTNEEEAINELKAVSIDAFFTDLKMQVTNYYQNK